MHPTVTRRTTLKAGFALAAVGVLGSATAQDGNQGGGHGIPPRLPSAIEIDRDAGTVTLPLYRGNGPDGDVVWFVVTESTRFDDAVKRGVNWAPKLANALDSAAVQPARGQLQTLQSRTQTSITFEATPDFGPERTVVPGPEGFPIDAEDSQPGGDGGDVYSPLVATENETVYNAPHVENRTGRHDKAVRIDRDRREVTLSLTPGFYEGEPVEYLSTDAAPADVAALEGGTFAPALAQAPAPGDRDLETAAREPIFAVVNGPMGETNPNRQGLRSAVAGQGSPLNVTRSEQVCADAGDPTDCSVFYSPLWDVYPMVWTEEAVQAGERTRLTSHQQIIDRFLRGQLESAAPDGPPNTLMANIPAAGPVVNCPLILVGDGEA